MEFIARLTDEQVETCRLFDRAGNAGFDIRNVDDLVAVTVTLRAQAIAAIKLADEAIAAAAEASDE